MKKLISIQLISLAMFYFLFITFLNGQSVFKTKVLLLPMHDRASEITYEVIDGWAVFEEDIVLGRDEDLRDLRGMQLAVVRDDSRFLWPNRIMPYRINNNISNDHREVILNAMRHIQESTSVRFVERTNQADFVEFIYHPNNPNNPNRPNPDNPNHSCWSRVGRVGGRQLIQLNQGGCGFGTMVHEICHALGFFHEQSRCDRDDHIEIIWSNINSERQNQFAMRCNGAMDVGPYDFESIMHYRWNAFAINRNEPTIIPKQEGVTIGQRNGLSIGDIDAINRLYPLISNKVTGLFQEREQEVFLWIGANWESFYNRWQNYGRRGLRLIDIEVHQVDGRWRYNGIWEKGEDKHELLRHSTWSEFVREWKELRDDGYRLVDIETFEEGGQRHFVGIWRAGTGGYGLYRLNGWKALDDKFKELEQKNLILVDVERYKSGDDTYFLGVWRGGRVDQKLYQTASWSSFRRKSGEFQRDGFRMIDFERVKEGRRFWYIGVWNKETNQRAFWHNVPWHSFVKKRREWAERGIYLTDFEVH